MIYEHRYFSLAARAWTTMGDPEARDPDVSEVANELLPGIGVLLQDSLLMHGRNLIDFYVQEHQRSTDIAAIDFGFNYPNAEKLQRFKDPIDVHLSHITAWRDESFRRSNESVKGGTARQRLNWDTENAELIHEVNRALDHAANAGGRWVHAYAALRDACIALQDHGSDWPDRLAKPHQLNAYLASLDLY